MPPASQDGGDTRRRKRRCRRAPHTVRERPRRRAPGPRPPRGPVRRGRAAPPRRRLHEIIANGCFLMDTSDGRSERLLVDAALGALADGASARRPDRRPRRRLLARTRRRRAALGPDRGRRAGAGHHRLAPRPGRSPRSRRPRSPTPGPRSSTPISSHTSMRHADTYDALCLDIDNGPDWTVTEGNEALYSAGRTRRLRKGVEARRGTRGVVRQPSPISKILAECRVPRGAYRRDPGCPGRSGRRASRGPAWIAEQRSLPVPC